MAKLNGYRPSHRNRWLLIKENVLTLQQLTLFEYYIDIMDFDNRHSGYGTFEVDFILLTEIFNNRSANTARNWHSVLLKKGFIKKAGKANIFTITNPERYIQSGMWQGKPEQYVKQEKDQPIEVILRSIGVNLQKNEVHLQNVVKNNSDIDSENISRTLVSSKDNSNVSLNRYVIIKQNVRSDKEYDLLSNNLNSLSVDDMRWIDQNVAEKIEVTSENEKEVAKIYFKGDIGLLHASLLVHQ